MATKRKKPATRRSPKRPCDEKLAEILTYCATETIEDTAEKFGVSDRSIWRWKALVTEGKLPRVADLVREIKEASIERCKDLLTDVYETGLRALKDRIATASYREVLDTVVETGGLKNVKDSLGDESSDQDTSADQGRQKTQGATSVDPRGTPAEASAGLRVIG